MPIPRRPRIRIPDFSRPTAKNLHKAVDTLVDAVDATLKNINREGEKILEPLQERFLRIFELCEEILRTDPKKLPIFVTFLSGMLHAFYTSTEYIYSHREEIQHAGEDFLANTFHSMRAYQREFQEQVDEIELLRRIEEQRRGAELNKMLFPEDYEKAKNLAREYKEASPETRKPLPITFVIETGERFFKGVSVENFDAGREKVRTISEEARAFAETFTRENGRAPTESEEYDAVFAKHRGIQDDNQNSAYILAVTGRGNCQARAELYLLFLEQREGKMLDEAYFAQHPYGVDIFRPFQTLSKDKKIGHIEISLLVKPDTVSVFGAKRAWIDSTSRRTRYPISVYSDVFADAFYPPQKSPEDDGAIFKYALNFPPPLTLPMFLIMALLLKLQLNNLNNQKTKHRLLRQRAKVYFSISQTLLSF